MKTCMLLLLILALAACTQSEPALPVKPVPEPDPQQALLVEPLADAIEEDIAEPESVPVAQVAVPQNTSNQQPSKEPANTSNNVIYASAPFYGPTSLEQRIADSDLVIIGRMISTANTVEEANLYGQNGYVGALRFTFDVSEVLKAPSGSTTPTRIVALVPSLNRQDTRDQALVASMRMLSERNSKWDDRNAVVFLSNSNLRYPATQSDDLYFMSIVDYEYGLGDLYSLESKRNKMWLPETQPAGGDDGVGSGTAAAKGTTERWFLTDVPQTAPTTQSRSSDSNQAAEEPSVTLTSLQAVISSINIELNAETSMQYKWCVGKKYERKSRSTFMESQGKQYIGDPLSYEAEISSGLPANTEAFTENYKTIFGEDGWESTSEYSGDDAHLFATGTRGKTWTNTYTIQTSSQSVLARVEYEKSIEPLVTTRPLPSGVYELTRKFRPSYSVLCDPDHFSVSPITITVIAPPGTLHEAFFDPVTDGSAVAADSSNGQLEPAAFTDANNASATLQRIEWQTDTVKVKVSPHTGMAGHKLDFIELDGSVSLSLQIDDATVDAANKTLSWSVTEQPWHDGDLLMLRIKEVVPEIALIDVPETITQGSSESVTLKVTGLTSSNSYSIGLSSNNNAIGFGDGCGTAGTTVSIPSGNTSHSKTLTLHGCSVSSDTVTASLKQGTATIATATADVQIEASASVTVSLSPRKERFSTETDMTVDWTDPDSCDGNYFVALYDTNGTVARHLGNHPAPQTTTLSVELPVAWEDVPNDQRSVRVTCTPTDGDWRIVGETPLRSGLP